MGAREFAEWQVMFANEQLHPAIARVRHAQMLAAIYTGAATPPTGEKAHRPINFMMNDPWALPPAPKPPPTYEQIRADVERLNGRFNRGH